MAINNNQVFGMKKTSANSWTWLPTPAKGGVTITDEPVWASNTGRGSDGKMIGDIVAWKTTVEVTWPPLTFSDASSIVTALTGAGAFFNIKYYDTSTSTMVEKTVYCSNVPRTMYSLATAAQKHMGVTVTFIEQ